MSEETIDLKHHWETVYSEKDATEVSWFQDETTVSENLIIQHAQPTEAIIDVGGGASRLVDNLLIRGYSDVTVLDIASSALSVSKTRLGDSSRFVKWVADNILTVDLPEAHYQIWHDRAVFHFLTSHTDRQNYVDKLRSALRPGGYAIIATFADDGPSRCSGLAACRYSESTLHAELGIDFELCHSEREMHQTPWKSVQAFLYCLFRLK